MVKRAFSIRSEFVWTVVGVQYSAITAKRKASAASGRSSARKLEAAALRQLQRCDESPRLGLSESHSLLNRVSLQPFMC